MAARFRAPHLAIDGEEHRILTLLSVAYWRATRPAVIVQLRRASLSLARGNRPLAAILVAQAGLPRLEEDERIGFRLFAAEKLLDAGVTPRELTKGLGLDPWPLDALAKDYNPDEPRDERGRWTDSGENGDTSADSAEASLSFPVSPSAPIPGLETDTVPTPRKLAGDLKFAEGTSVIDPNTGKPYPVPPGMDISANVARGRSIAHLAGPLTVDGVPVDGRAAYMTDWFFRGQELDFQRPDGFFGASIGHYRDVTNYNFGAVAEAAGYTLEQALTAAGIYNSNFGNPQPGDTSYGIKPDAVANITHGWNDVQDGKW
jgi:hypothetical protein